jgi:hypothetical protein
VSDARARELERRFRESGALVDEVAWLTHRARADFDTVALDAYLGHSASQLALGEAAAPITFAGVDDIALWLRGFAAWGRVTVVRVALAWARVAAGPEAVWTPAFRAAQAAVDAWVLAADRGQVARLLAPFDEATHDLAVTREANTQRIIASHARAILYAWSRPDRERGDPLLHELERSVLDLGASPSASALRGLVRAWTPAPRLVLPLAEGARVRERVELAVTPRERRARVAALRPRVVGCVTHERIEGSLDGTSPMLSVSLADWP